MHEIKTTITVSGNVTTEVVTYDFANQEEVIDFLPDFASFEMGVLYDRLRKEGDRTTVYAVPCHRKAMSRTIEGTARSDGRKPVEGSVRIEVRRVA